MYFLAGLPYVLSRLPYPGSLCTSNLGDEQLKTLGLNTPVYYYYLLGLLKPLWSPFVDLKKVPNEIVFKQAIIIAHWLFRSLA